MIDFCIHFANVLYLVSFLTRDMMWLRILTCAGLGMGLVFFSCQPTPMYGCIIWHVVFLIINTYQIQRLVVERRALVLSKKQERIGEAAFSDLNRDELLTLLARVMCESPAQVSDIHEACHHSLTKEEQVLRDVAFSRLSRSELLNLLTRRMWGAIAKLNPARWSRGRRAQGLVSTQSTSNGLA